MTYITQMLWALVVANKSLDAQKRSRLPEYWTINSSIDAESADSIQSMSILIYTQIQNTLRLAHVLLSRITLIDVITHSYAFCGKAYQFDTGSAHTDFGI